ncbi:MAG: hypothetical protein KDE56_30155 [Anaerolineales bacterium]|nr:hypothetical protein [Anaerolineales bacterium]
MQQVWPHEYFRLDFDQIIEEARRQEQVSPKNIGELSIVTDMHYFFSNDVLSTILDNDWVFDAANQFAKDYAKDCFRNLQLSGQEIYSTQQKLLKLKEKATGFLALAGSVGLASLEDTDYLTKASDFIRLLKFDEMGSDLQKHALELVKEIAYHEDLQVRVVLRGIDNCYEKIFTRIMFVVRRSLKIKLGKTPKPSDAKLLQPSDYVDWLESNTDKHHILNNIFVQQREFYKAARNVENHHEGLEWIADKDEIILPDLNNTIRIHVDEFHQRFRFLVHFCDLGLRGILSAFCEREKGVIANKLVEAYDLTFPEDWLGGEEGKVNLYQT